MVVVIYITGGTPLLSGRDPKMGLIRVLIMLITPPQHLHEMEGRFFMLFMARLGLNFNSAH